MTNFQIETVSWQLNEALIHLKDLIKEVDAGEYDEDGDVAYGIMLQQIYEHLNMSWNTRNIEATDDESAEFGKYSEILPEFHRAFKVK